MNTVYCCDICGRELATEQAASVCKDKGIPLFKYEIGWSMQEYDGDFVAHIVSRRINFDRDDHIVEYGMQYLDGPEGVAEFPQGYISEWVSEHRIDLAEEKRYY